jgi:hypothetical protein
MMTPADALTVALQGNAPPTLAEALRRVGRRGRTPATARLARLMSGIDAAGPLPPSGTGEYRAYRRNIRGLQPGRGRRIRSTSRGFLERAQRAVLAFQAALLLADLADHGGRTRIAGYLVIEGYPVGYRVVPAAGGEPLSRDDCSTFGAYFLEGDVDAAVDEHLGALSESYGPTIEWDTENHDEPADYIKIWVDGTVES